MTPSQLKLYELLKTDEQVRGLNEELKEGCLVSWEGEILKFVGYGTPSMNGNHECIFLRGNRTQTIKKDKIEIIGLPLSEHFIRLWLYNKFENEYSFNGEGIIKFNTEGYDNGEYWGTYDFIRIENYNSMKDFNSQSDEYYDKIYTALSNL